MKIRNLPLLVLKPVFKLNNIFISSILFLLILLFNLFQSFSQVWSSTSVPGPSFDLYSIWGTNSSDLWAVGKYGTHGQVAHFDGTIWEASVIPNGYFNDVWGADNSNIWAVCNTGKIKKICGVGCASWDETLTNTNPLNSIWGTDANNIWAVGDNGTILKYNGTAWVSQASGTGFPLYTIWGIDANNIWAAGYNVILKYNGTSWSIQKTIGSFIRDIWGTSTTNVYGLGPNNLIYRFNGSTWDIWQNIDFSSNELFQIKGIDNSNIIGVGVGGRISKYNGTTWTTIMPVTTSLLRDLWYQDNCNIIIPGHGNTIVSGSCPPLCTTTRETAKSGNWNDPTVWLCGTIPDMSNMVVIKTGHNITVPLNYTANALNVEINGNIIYEENGVLHLGN